MSQNDGVLLVLPDKTDSGRFGRMVESLGWVKQETQMGDGQRKAYKETWRTSDARNTIKYVDDPLTLTRFFWLYGPDSGELLPEIWGVLPAYAPNELLEMVAEAETEEEAIRAVLKIAVGFPNFDSEVLRVFETYAKSFSAPVREATVQAMAYRLWPESVPFLQRMAHEDTDENVRRFAQSILNHLVK
jgi:hypothetical protein